MVYLAIKNGQVACRTNADTMRRLDGVEPELIITDAEYQANREIEEEARERQLQINACEAELERIDRDAMAGRAVRELVLQLADQAELTGKAVEILQSFEAKAAPIRMQRETLVKSAETAQSGA